MTFFPHVELINSVVLNVSQFSDTHPLLRTKRKRVYTGSRNARLPAACRKQWKVQMHCAFCSTNTSVVTSWRSCTHHRAVQDLGTLFLTTPCKEISRRFSPRLHCKVAGTFCRRVSSLVPFKRWTQWSRVSRDDSSRPENQEIRQLLWDTSFKYPSGLFRLGSQAKTTYAC
jgi:hypothetical protein